MNDIIEEKSGVLSVLENKINYSLESYNQTLKDKAALDEEIKILKQDKTTLTERIEEISQQIPQEDAELQTKRADLLVLNNTIKSKQAQSEELNTIIAQLKEKQEADSNILIQKQKDEDLIDQQILQKQEDLKKYRQLAELEQLHVNELIQSHKSKFEELESFAAQIKSKETILEEIDGKIDASTQILNEKNEQKVTLELLNSKYQNTMNKKISEISELDEQLDEKKVLLEDFGVRILDQEKLLRLKEARTSELNQLIEKANLDLEKKRAEFQHFDQATKEKQSDLDKMETTRQDIERKITESNHSFQKLKDDLETEEKEIREKEARIHRLEVLSFLYRISKVFGGILLGIGIFFLIIGFSMFFDLINITTISGEILLPLLITSGALFVISGVFQLEKL